MHGSKRLRPAIFAAAMLQGLRCACPPAPALPRPALRHTPALPGWRALCAAVLLGTALPAFAAPSFEQVRQAFASSESVLLDRHGEELHRLRTNPQVRRGQWVALEDISPALQTAMVYSEDKRFYEHSGCFNFILF